MKDTETKLLFIELRANGLSFSKIARQLNVNKNTLLIWSKELDFEISNAQQAKLDEIQEQYRLTKQARYERLGKQLQAITTELEKRDLSNVPTEKLIDMLLKITTAANAEYSQAAFKRKDSFGIKDYWTA